MSSLVEVVENQAAIISIQSGVIKDLFMLLGQYMEAEELAVLPQVDRINETARLAAEMRQL